MPHLARSPTSTGDIDDFGQPLPAYLPPQSWDSSHLQVTGDVPPKPPRSNTERVVAAVGNAVESDVRVEQGVDERASLLATGWASTNAKDSEDAGSGKRLLDVSGAVCLSSTSP